MIAPVAFFLYPVPGFICKEGCAPSIEEYYQTTPEKIGSKGISLPFGFGRKKPNLLFMSAYAILSLIN